MAMGIIQVGSEAAKSVNQRVPPSANPGSAGRLESPMKGRGYPAMPRIVSDIVTNRGICTQGKRKLTRGLHRLAEYSSLALARYCHVQKKKGLSGVSFQYHCSIYSWTDILPVMQSKYKSYRILDLRVEGSIVSSLELMIHTNACFECLQPCL